LTYTVVAVIVPSRPRAGDYDERVSGFESREVGLQVSWGVYPEEAEETPLQEAEDERAMSR
jgi:hypothetical protein